MPRRPASSGSSCGAWQCWSVLASRAARWDPLGLLTSIRRALRLNGVYVCLDINCSDKLEENARPPGAMFHGVSVLYCMTASLAHGGAGLGTVGFHEPKVRELCSAAGFSSVRKVPLENPFNNLYEIKAD